MQPARVVARLAFAYAELDARIRWRSHQTPTFDAQLAAGPFTTLVAFLPQSFAAELAASVAALPALAEHFRYPPAQLHMTVRNLDGADLASLPVLLNGLQPISLCAGGLGFTRETLLLRLLTVNSTLRCLRMRLDGLPGMRPARLALHDLAFANVLRFNGPIASELRRSVGRRPDPLAGREIELDELTLIRTDKVGSPAHSEVLGRYSLGAV